MWNLGLQARLEMRSQVGGLRHTEISHAETGNSREITNGDIQLRQSHFKGWDKRGLISPRLETASTDIPRTESDHV